MDILISAIVGDLISRSASFVIGKYFQQQPDINKIVQRLQSVVLRIDIVVEEAEARHITNQGMLRQLKMLRQGMYRGHYVLDAMRFTAALEEEVSHSSSALSKSSPAKRLRFSRTGSGSSNREALLFGTNSNMREELQQMVDTLEDTVAGMKEFLFFLELYPRILRQPYGTYLLLDNCMFGRQTERACVLKFLLCPNVMPDLAVLPIIGPRRVGKSTLVEYVCRDENVRGHFSMILFFPEGSLKDEGLVDLCLQEDEAVYRRRLVSSSKYFLICNHHQLDFSEEIPKITVHDIIFRCGDTLPCGKFEALAWRSRIPPYYNFVGLNMQSCGRFSLPDHSHDLVCHELGATRYGTPIAPKQSIQVCTFVGLSMQSCGRLSLPDHSHDLVCHELGATRYGTKTKTEHSSMDLQKYEDHSY